MVKIVIIDGTRGGPTSELEEVVIVAVGDISEEEIIDTIYEYGVVAPQIFIEHLPDMASLLHERQIYKIIIINEKVIEDTLPDNIKNYIAELKRNKVVVNVPFFENAFDVIAELSKQCKELTLSKFVEENEDEISNVKIVGENCDIDVFDIKTRYNDFIAPIEMVLNSVGYGFLINIDANEVCDLSHDALEVECMKAVPTTHDKIVAREVLEIPTFFEKRMEFTVETEDNRKILCSVEHSHLTIDGQFTTNEVEKLKNLCLEKLKTLNLKL